MREPRNTAILRSRLVVTRDAAQQQRDRRKRGGDSETEQRIRAGIMTVLDIQVRLFELRAGIVTDDTAEIFNEALNDVDAATDKLREFVEARKEEAVSFIEDVASPAPGEQSFFSDMTEEDERHLEGAA